MSRAQRLLDLIQILRGHRYPVTGAVLADELGISLRTLYRDIGALQAQGAAIDGAPGLGYMLQPGFMLPPLMFTEDEIEALALGSRWVVERGDIRLSKAASRALDKIAAVLPVELRAMLDASGLLVGPGEPIPVDDETVANLRQAIRNERKIEIRYRDANAAETRRTVWPFALGYFDRVQVLVAWCELRQDFRHFRTDRMGELVAMDERYPRRRQVLLREWREKEGISGQ